MQPGAFHMNLTNRQDNTAPVNDKTDQTDYTDNLNSTAMNKEKMQQLMSWLNDQIIHANDVIKESHQSSNPGRESQYEGMRDAFMRCLNMINQR